MEKVTSAVWRPPTGSPVGRDPDVRRFLSQLHDTSDRLARRWTGLLFLAAVCLLAGLWASAILATLAVLTSGIRMLRFWLRMGRHRRAIGDLLAAEPARRVDTAYPGGHVLVADGTVLRFPVLSAAARAAEQVWLVGPNAAGLAVVFVDGVVVPQLGQVLPEVPAQLSGGRPVRPGPVKTAQASARVKVRNFSRRWLFILVMTVSIGSELAPQPQVLAWLYAIAGVLILVFGGREWLRIAPCLHAAALLRAPLVEHPARLVSERSVTVSRPDGSGLAGEIQWSASLLANVRASGRLWIAGTPEVGVTLGVGMPDFPIAGVVRFS